MLHMTLTILTLDNCNRLLKMYQSRRPLPDPVGIARVTRMLGCRTTRMSQPTNKIRRPLHLTLAGRGACRPDIIVCHRYPLTLRTKNKATITQYRPRRREGLTTSLRRTARRRHLQLITLVPWTPVTTHEPLLTDLPLWITLMGAVSTRRQSR